MKFIQTLHPWYSTADYLANQSLRRLSQVVDNAASSTRHLWRSPNTYVDQHNYYIRYEIPGVTREQLNLSVEKEHLTLCITPDIEKPASTQTFDLPIPEGTDSSQSSAKLENGVLTITLAKKPKPQPHSIEIT